MIKIFFSDIGSREANHDLLTSFYVSSYIGNTKENPILVPQKP